MSKGATYYTLLAALRQRELLDDATQTKIARAPAVRRRRRARSLAFPRLRRLVSR
jgi:hypothetical protein